MAVRIKIVTGFTFALSHFRTFLLLLIIATAFSLTVGVWQDAGTLTEYAKEFVMSNEDVKVYSEDQFKGLLADKQAEVKKRQSIEAELAELKGSSL